jgi:cysteine-rich repeat protein
MRVSLRWIALFSIAGLPALAGGCECTPTPGDDAGVEDAGSLDDAAIDAFVPDRADAGRDAGPRPDTGTDAAMMTMTCGDGSIDGTEMCDDGDTDPGDGCDADCQTEMGWSCTGEPSVCTNGCGDGAISASEGCDDGGMATGDGCGADCQVEAGWSCPAGAPTRDCTTDCGDGVAAVGREECDDGNLTDGDGCDDGIGPDDGAGPAWLPACLDTRCGNGIPTTGEACDDGNTTSGDGCSMTCTLE